MNNSTEQKKNKVKLLICYHKPSMLLKDDVLTPIHVGRAIAEKNMDHDSDNYKWLMENMIGDDTGENISEKNGYYNEMTAIYWAWKNYDKLGNPDYIGLMHYRRHYIFDDHISDVVNVRDMRNVDVYLDFLNYSENKISDFVDNYDFLPHIGKVGNVYEHYIKNQRKEDIDLACDIVLEKYPEYKGIMEEYFAGGDSNFCNMCIFKKELFFRYCEWIFSILEEFEKRRDMSEKRFFISERLTGIFVAGLMKNKELKYKTLPIAFIDEPVDIPIVLYADEDTETDAAVFLKSLMVKKDDFSRYSLFIMCPERYAENAKELCNLIIGDNGYCTVKIVTTEKSPDELPLYLEQYLPKINKCIYVSGCIVAFKDLGEFFRICSVDDYMAVGVPERIYDPSENNKRISGDLMVLNLKKIRKRDIASMYEKNKDVNKCFKGEVGYIPDYFLVSEHLANNGTRVFSDVQKRSEIQNYVLWHVFMVYNECDPKYNFQGIFSVFWWDMFAKLPLKYQRINVSLTGLKSICLEQQREIDGFERKAIEVFHEEKHEQTEEWRSYGFWGKLKFYYVHNGLKQTIRYAFYKLSGKGKAS